MLQPIDYVCIAVLLSVHLLLLAGALRMFCRRVRNACTTEAVVQEKCCRFQAGFPEYTVVFTVGSQRLILRTSAEEFAQLRVMQRVALVYYADSLIEFS